MINQFDMNWRELDLPFTDTIATIPFTPMTDVMSIAQYLNLARALTLLQEETFGYPEVHLNTHQGEMLRETLAQALNWFDQMGIKQRHPELNGMPTEINPCAFLDGDENTTAEWLAEKLETATVAAMKKLDYASN